MSISSRSGVSGSKDCHVSNIIMYWNWKVDSLWGSTLPKLPIISNKASNKNFWELKNLLYTSSNINRTKKAYRIIFIENYMFLCFTPKYFSTRSWNKWINWKNVFWPPHHNVCTIVRWQHHMFSSMSPIIIKSQIPSTFPDLYYYQSTTGFSKTAKVHFNYF